MNRNENGPNCGCGFIAKYDNGDRICLYCPYRWNIKNTENMDNKSLEPTQTTDGSA